MKRAPATRSSPPEATSLTTGPMPGTGPPRGGEVSKSKIQAPPSPPASVPRSSDNQTLTHARDARIRRRAYELYVQGGCRDGHAEEDWFAAEVEIEQKEK